MRGKFETKKWKHCFNFLKLLPQEAIKMQIFTSFDKLIGADPHQGKGQRSLEYTPTFEGSTVLIIMPTSWYLYKGLVLV